LLKDDRFTITVAQRARGLFNWQCADLIEIFINIAKLEWNEPLCPGTSIEQFGLDLLCRILAADVKRLYDAAIDDVRANQYGVIPKNKNPMDLICMKYTHPLTTIAPDRSHTIKLINNIQDKTNDLAYYINKLSDLTKTIQPNTKWTKKVYLRGAKPQTLSGSNRDIHQHRQTRMERTALPRSEYRAVWTRSLMPHSSRRYRTPL
jgi:hypothetical protein